MTLLPWLRLHLNKHSNQGSALHAVSVVAKEIEEFPWTILEGELKSRIGGTTT